MSALEEAAGLVERDGTAGLAPATVLLEGVDRLLRGPPGLRCLLAGEDVAAAVAGSVERVSRLLSGLEARLDAGAVPVAPEEQEAVNSAVVALKDSCWAVAHDRLG
ncbi:MAG: hypothetical protein ACRDWW_04220, partial [Acidimicrobiales bacterium]